MKNKKVSLFLMRTFQAGVMNRLPSTSVAAATVAFVLHANMATAGPPNNVQVNPPFSGPFAGNKQNEPSLSQNPTNPLNLIAGANDQTGWIPGRSSTSGYYASFDGGATWPCHGSLDLSAFGMYAFGDPAQAFDSQGNAYYGTLAFPIGAPAGAEPSDFFMAKSSDGGCHYTVMGKVNGASKGIFDDKDAIAADGHLNSPFRDNVYAAWVKLPGKSVANQVLFGRSTDGGATWSKPLQLSAADSTADSIRSGAAVQVGSDGTVYVTWVNTKANPAKPASIQMTISRDGGKTFLTKGREITVATVTDDGLPLPGTSFRQGARIFPSFTIAPNGALHIAWVNHTNGHAVVLTTKSTDGGRTWSAPVVAGNVNSRSAIFASMTADPNNNVNLVFQALDDREQGTSPGAGAVAYDTYFTQSTDGGASFGNPVKLSTASSDPDGSSTNGLSAQFIGDYISAVSDSRGRRIFAVWTDSRNSTPCPAVDVFRASEPGTVPPPNVANDCPVTFGNTDIYFGTIDY
jgi:hypothetical protein